MHRRTFLAGAATLLATQSRAHTAPSGMVYDPYCCNGNDCRPAPEGAVRGVKGGWAVTLNPGDHPMITKPLRAFMAHADTKPSEDGAFHICVWPQDTLRCLYVVQGGV